MEASAHASSNCMFSTVILQKPCALRSANRAAEMMAASNLEKTQKIGGSLTDAYAG